MAQFFPFGTTNYTIDLMVPSASTILAGLSKGDSKAGEVTSITFHGKAPMSNKRHTNKLKATQLEIRKLLMQKVPETYKWLLQSELDQVATNPGTQPTQTIRNNRGDNLLVNTCST